MQVRYFSNTFNQGSAQTAVYPGFDHIGLPAPIAATNDLPDLFNAFQFSCADAGFWSVGEDDQMGLLRKRILFQCLQRPQGVLRTIIDEEGYWSEHGQFDER